MGKYPKTVNWIVWKKNPDGSYHVKNCLTEETYVLGKLAFQFLRKLDGKQNPFTAIPELTFEDVTKMLDTLADEGFLRYGRFLSKSFLSIRYTVWFAKHSRAHTCVPAVLDTARMVLCMPVFIAGILIYLNHMPTLTDEPIWPGILLGTLLGMIFHELSHLLSCLHWGGRVFELGVSLQCGLPGMYVLMDDSTIHSNLKKALTSSAGIEANLMLAGIFAILSTIFTNISLCLSIMAMANLWLALLNLLPADSLDGMGILRELIGSKYAVDMAKRIVKSKRQRHKLCRKGFQGYIQLIACYILILLQITMPILIAMSAVEVIMLCKLLFV